MTIQVRIGAGRLGRPNLSVRKYLEIHFWPDRGKSEGCGQKEARAGVWAHRRRRPEPDRPKPFWCGNTWKFVFGPIEENQRIAGKRKPAGRRPAPHRPPNLSVRKYLEIHFWPDRGKSEGCRQKEAARGSGGRPPSSRSTALGRAAARGRLGRTLLGSCGGANGGTIADLLEFGKNYLKFLFYRR
jgi:hypothetical protein